MKKFVEIDHPADLALRVFSHDLPGLFINALEGMYSLIFDKEICINKEITSKAVKIHFETFNVEELLVDWLSEMLYKIEVGDEIVTACKIMEIQKISENIILSAKINLMKTHILNLEQISEIKAVTYHQLKIEKSEEGYSTIIVFDV